MTYVEVSFAEPVGDGTLTYHTGKNQLTPAVGCRAVAQVQSRRLIGYITRVHDEQPAFKTVALGEILDPLPLFSDAMIQLARTVADDCVCNIGEVLHCMLPGGIKQHITRLIRYKAGDNDSEALQWLSQQSDWTNYSTFTGNFPQAAGMIRDWLSQGVIEIEHSVSQSAGPRIVKVLRIPDNTPIEPEKLTPREKLVIEAILRMSSAPTAAALARAANVSSAPISQLKKKGLLEEVNERVMRQVGTGDYYQRSPELPPQLTEEQQQVLNTINKAFTKDRRPVLIRGVTCSGKTEVYLRWAAEILAQNRSAIVLVPEISLTPQMMKRFIDRFGDKVAILHSKLSDGERFDQWEKIRRGLCPVVVGARSAVFAPVPNLGTIILDEEGEPSFKQGESPRYHAREVAIARCRIENALLVMGSATPTIDSFYYSQSGRYHLIEMNKRVSNRMPPRVKVVDMRHELVTRNNRSIFSEALTNGIKNTIKAGKQVILFLNRRGFSSFVFCRECGEAIECSRCKVSLVYHTGSQIMRCHYCGEMKNVPTICPKCQSRAIKFFGAGTQRVEAEANRYFPGIKIRRLDSDTVSTKGSMEQILDDFGQGKIDVLIGTQMVAKGLDFPNVTLVGILAADSLLRIPDFRASERNFSLLAQVAGRTGRGDTPGDVILQTYYPEHHSIQHAITENFHGFFAEESKMRQAALFPPFIELASFIVSSTDQNRAMETARQIAGSFSQEPDVSEEMVLGPAPASLQKINERFRVQLLLRMPDLNRLTELVRKVLKSTRKTGDTRINVDINPFFML